MILFIWLDIEPGTYLGLPASSSSPFTSASQICIASRLVRNRSVPTPDLRVPMLNSGPTPTPVVFYCWENRLVIYLELGDFAVETRLMNWHLGVSASFLGRSVGRCSLRSLICEVKVYRQFVGHDEIIKQFFFFLN